MFLDNSVVIERFARRRPGMDARSKERLAHILRTVDPVPAGRGRVSSSFDVPRSLADDSSLYLQPVSAELAELSERGKLLSTVVVELVTALQQILVKQEEPKVLFSEFRIKLDELLQKLGTLSDEETIFFKEISDQIQDAVVSLP